MVQLLIQWFLVQRPVIKMDRSLIQWALIFSTNSNDNIINIKIPLWNYSFYEDTLYSYLPIIDGEVSSNSASEVCPVFPVDNLLCSSPAHAGPLNEKTFFDSNNEIHSSGKLVNIFQKFVKEYVNLQQYWKPPKL